MLRFICEAEGCSNSCYIPCVVLHDNIPKVVWHGCRYVNSDAVVEYIYNKYKKQLQKIERKVGMEYQKAYKQG